MDYRTVRAKVKRPTPRQIEAAKLLADPSKTIAEAMRGAGYAPSTIDQGMRAVPATVLALMPKEANLVELGRMVSPQEQEHMVRGRLMLNVLRGKDNGVNSAYRLGQDKRVNMFQPEQQVGVMVINAPESVQKTIAAVPEDEDKPAK